MKGIMVHDPEHCHSTRQTPTEGQQIIINTNEDVNGVANGFYSQNKWFNVAHEEIEESSIMCWHDEDDDIDN